MSNFYLSTAIAYVNGRPHIGHALEFAQADMLARFHRLCGDETFLLTGTDEHGSKIYKMAQDLGVDTQKLVDENAAVFRSLDKLMNFSYDDFIQTSEARHKAGAQKLWRLMDAAGDLYRDSYEGLYCVGCEAYLSEKDLDEAGNCPIHKKPPELLKEENYFFRLSKYSQQIRDLIESGRLKIVPEARKNEMLNLIGDGLPDVSFSRPRAVLPWGVEVPGDPDQVMYVWGDALSNYITALGFEHEDERFRKFWPANVHLIGKDILRFHAGIWIGMLLSAGVQPPQAIYVHGFVTSEGEKMSKSLGNVVDPIDFAAQYSIDALRYYLLRAIPSGDDGDFSRQRFMELYNAELANSLGNLVNRVVMMVERYSAGVVPEATAGEECVGMVEDIFVKYRTAIDNFELKMACEAVVELTTFANKYIDEKKPWALAKENSSDLLPVLYNLLELLRFIAILLLPILPHSAEKICENLGLKVGDLTFDSTWGLLKSGENLHPTAVIFPRIEPEVS